METDFRPSRAKRISEGSLEVELVGGTYVVQEGTEADFPPKANVLPGQLRLESCFTFTHPHPCSQCLCALSIQLPHLAVGRCVCEGELEVIRDSNI